MAEMGVFVVPPCCETGLVYTAFHASLGIVTYHRGVQAGTGEALSSDEAFGGLELRLKVGLLPVRAIVVCCSVVETLVGGSGGRNGHGQGDSVGDGLHFERAGLYNECANYF